MRLILAVLCAAVLCAGAEPLLLQKPTLNQTHIVFVYAGDLWSVPRDGGDAVRITSGAVSSTPGILPIIAISPIRQGLPSAAAMRS